MLPAFVLKQLYQPLLLDHQCKCQESKKERWSVGVLIKIPLVWDIPGGPVVESPPSNAGDLGPIPAQETEIPHDRDCWSHYGKWRAQLCNKRSLHTATREAPMCLNEDPAQPKIIIKNKHKIKTQSYWKKKNSPSLLDFICEALSVPQNPDYTLTTRAVDKHITTIPLPPPQLSRQREALLKTETPLNPWGQWGVCFSVGLC